MSMFKELTGKYKIYSYIMQDSAKAHETILSDCRYTITCLHQNVGNSQIMDH
jgi:hypothetical protein